MNYMIILYIIIIIGYYYPGEKGQLDGSYPVRHPPVLLDVGADPRHLRLGRLLVLR